MHYLLYGADEGRNPNADFNTLYYIKNNTDVTQSSLNPFIHFKKLKDYNCGFLPYDQMPLVYAKTKIVIDDDRITIEQKDNYIQKIQSNRFYKIYKIIKGK